MTTATMEKPAVKVVGPAEWLARAETLLAKEKEFTRLRDELSGQAAGNAVGESRKEIRIRWRERQRNSGGPVRRAQPTDRVSLHVRSGMEGRMPELLVPGRLV